jgi:hypothetical protein
VLWVGIEATDEMHPSGVKKHASDKASRGGTATRLLTARRFQLRPLTVLDSCDELHDVSGGFLDRGGSAGHFGGDLGIFATRS